MALWHFSLVKQQQLNVVVRVAQKWPCGIEGVNVDVMTGLLCRWGRFEIFVWLGDVLHPIVWPDKYLPEYYRSVELPKTTHLPKTIENHRKPLKNQVNRGNYALQVYVFSSLGLYIYYLWYFVTRYMLMPLYHGFIDLKRIAVSEKLSPSAKNQYLYI